MIQVYLHMSLPNPSPFPMQSSKKRGLTPSKIFTESLPIYRQILNFLPRRNFLLNPLPNTALFVTYVVFLHGLNYMPPVIQGNIISGHSPRLLSFLSRVSRLSPTAISRAESGVRGRGARLAPRPHIQTYTTKPTKQNMIH